MKIAKLTNKQRGTLGVFLGIALNAFGDWVLGVRIEVFKGMATFTFPWMVDVFLVPFLSGMLVGKVYAKRGGKWLACIPPLVVRSISYFKLYFVDHPPGDFFYSLHLHYWGPCVILAVEAANFGGILSEVLAGAYARKVVETK